MPVRTESGPRQKHQRATVHPVSTNYELQRGHRRTSSTGGVADDFGLPQAD